MGIICIGRQIGAGETTIAQAVAQALGWKCVDHQILDREVAETGASLPRIAHFDENAPGLIESWTHPNEAERYFEALQRILKEYADEGNVVIVGRGAGFTLRDRDVLHVRLIADVPFRVKRVMEIRWASEAHAHEIIGQNDLDRAAFHRKFFGLDWADPFLYDLVVPTSKVGVKNTISMLIAIARSRWPDAPH
jgi:cytidylate kinase